MENENKQFDLTNQAEQISAISELNQAQLEIKQLRQASVSHEQIAESSNDQYLSYIRQDGTEVKARSVEETFKLCPFLGSLANSDPEAAKLMFELSLISQGMSQQQAMTFTESVEGMSKKDDSNIQQNEKIKLITKQTDENLSYVNEQKVATLPEISQLSTSLDIEKLIAQDAIISDKLSLKDIKPKLVSTFDNKDKLKATQKLSSDPKLKLSSTKQTKLPQRLKAHEFASPEILQKTVKDLVIQIVDSPKIEKPVFVAESVETELAPDLDEDIMIENNEIKPNTNEIEFSVNDMVFSLDPVMTPEEFKLIQEHEPVDLANTLDSADIVDNTDPTIFIEQLLEDIGAPDERDESDTNLDFTSTESLDTIKSNIAEITEQYNILTQQTTDQEKDLILPIIENVDKLFKNIGNLSKPDIKPNIVMLEISDLEKQINELSIFIQNRLESPYSHDLNLIVNNLALEINKLKQTLSSLDLEEEGTKEARFHLRSSYSTSLITTNQLMQKLIGMLALLSPNGLGSAR